MRRKAPVPFGKGPTEKDPNHGHLAGGLLHSEGGRRKRTSITGTSSAAYPTSCPDLWGPGGEIPPGYPTPGHPAVWGSDRAVQGAAARVARLDA